MKIIKLLLPLFLFFTLPVKAEEGSIGFGVSVSVSGLFSPKLETVTVQEVEPYSAAEEAGVKVGHKIVSIDGCAIPGCPAFKAKKLMKRESGEILPLILEDDNGEHIPTEIKVR